MASARSCLALLACLPVAGAVACSDAQIAVPARGAVVDESRPVIAWTPIAGAYQYRVQVESRIPNGRIAARFDQVVAGASFTPPAPLAEEFAAVKVRITAHCAADAPASVSELGPAFFVDARGSCPAPHGIEVAQGERLRVAWAVLPAAREVQVSLFDAGDGALMAHQTTTGSTVHLSMPARPVVIALRSRCASGMSAMRYRVLAASR